MAGGCPQLPGPGSPVGENFDSKSWEMGQTWYHSKVLSVMNTMAPNMTNIEQLYIFEKTFRNTLTQGCTAYIKKTLKTAHATVSTLLFIFMLALLTLSCLHTHEQENHTPAHSVDLALECRELPKLPSKRC